MSVHIAQTSLLVLLALVTFAAVAWLGMRLCTALWRSLRPARFASVSAGALTVGFFVALYLLVLRPTPLHYSEVIPAPFDSDIYGGFAADGFRVYLYDQAGSGASIRVAAHADLQRYWRLIG